MTAKGRYKDFNFTFIDLILKDFEEKYDMFMLICNGLGADRTNICFGDNITSSEKQ